MLKCFPIVFLSIILFSCYDSNSFENVRHLKNGMTIKDVEAQMGEPLSYEYVNDSTEKRAYVYDNPGNGLDVAIRIIYENEKVISINER